MASRPELTGHASLFYNAKEARKYDSSSRMVGVQREITERAIELLRLSPKEGKLVLDVGCGSGLSGQVLEEQGHVWVGCDVSRDMLNVANERILEKNNKKKKNDDDDMEEVIMNDDDDDDDEDDDNNEQGQGGGRESSSSTGDLMHHDMGTGLPFRPATFDACISISALQWLCYSNSKAQIPRKRLTRFFSSLYQVLRRGGRAVLQFYPETAEQAVLISECAAKVGFAGGIVVDYPNSTKAKKHYLVLGFDKTTKTPQGLTSTAAAAAGIRVMEDESGKSNSKSRDNRNFAKKRRAPKKIRGTKTKEWILHKKSTQRAKGKEVRPDTKYTGRKRPTRF